MSNFLSQQTVAQGRPVSVRFVYANETDLNNDTRADGPGILDGKPLSVNDVGSVAHVTAGPGSFWFLVDASIPSAPVWSSLAFVVVPSAEPMLWFGDFSVSTSTTARYLFPGNSNSGDAHTIELGFRVTRAGTLKNLYIDQLILGTGGGDLVYTVRVDNGDTVIVATLANTATTGSNLVDNVVVANGAFVSIRVTKTGTHTTAVSHITAALEFAA